jgi:hypothetical protein
MEIDGGLVVWRDRGIRMNLWVEGGHEDIPRCHRAIIVGIDEEAGDFEVGSRELIMQWCEFHGRCQPGGGGQQAHGGGVFGSHENGGSANGDGDQRGHWRGARSEGARSGSNLHHGFRGGYRADQMGDGDYDEEICRSRHEQEKGI